MTWWNFYFIAKAGLHFKGYLNAAPLWNFLLFAAVVTPIPEKWQRAALLRRLRAGAGAVMALTLLWSETWLPPPAAIWKFLANPSTRPSFEYAWRFLTNSLNPWLLAAAAGLLAAAWAAQKNRIRLTPLTLVLLTAIAATAAKGTQGTIERFHEQEAGREVLPPKNSGKPDFDIILIHVCSLSWDDLAHTKFDARPFLSKFDYLFTNFNSATSYSNPAATRLLRAPCGQLSHGAIFREAPDNCYLMQELRGLGYRTYTLINHDGRYDGYMGKISHNAKADPMFPLQLQPAKLNFDDTPILSDRQALGAWLKEARRQSSPAAVYYNTISMHQGAHFSRAVVKNPWELDRFARYSLFLGMLTGELEEFFAELEASGRKAVVVFVPEHGAALEGSRLQAEDLRDIPFPQMTLVPLAIKIFGPGYKAGSADQRRIDKPVSYLALARTLYALMEHSPFTDKAASAKAVLSDIPETRLVSENENSVVMREGPGFVYRPTGGKWIAVPEDIWPVFTGDRYLANGPEAAK
jgi:cellulose synthase operon protein YhjU